MLLILIPSIWIAVAAFFVLLCRAAARGDAMPAASSERAPQRIAIAGLVLFEDPQLQPRRASRPRGLRIGTRVGV